MHRFEEFSDEEGELSEGKTVSGSPWRGARVARNKAGYIIPDRGANGRKLLSTAAAALGLIGFASDSSGYREPLAKWHGQASRRTGPLVRSRWRSVSS